MADDDPGTPGDIDPHRARLMDGLRAWGGAFGELGRRFGSSLGMHTTDTTALIEVISHEDKGAPLTQSGLSRRVGLTTGATSSLLNRLEDAGYVARSRERADRRVVTLRSTADVHRAVQSYFEPVGQALDEVMDRYPPDVLQQCADLVAELTAAMEAEVQATLSGHDR